MAEPVRELDFEEPDVSHLITEDDEPVDSFFAEREQHLLAHSLNTSWKPDCPFVAVANVGLFYALDAPPLVPDMMASRAVSFPEDVTIQKDKKNRSYFMWHFGKPPDVVVEIVSDRRGGEDTDKLEKYAQIGVPYYVIHDPARYLSKRVLRVFQRHGPGYMDMAGSLWLPGLELGLTLWEGEFEQARSTWLRWVDRDGALLLTGAELAARAQEAAVKAQEEAVKAQEEAAAAYARAESAEERAARLAARLRELGVNPEEL